MSETSAVTATPSAPAAEPVSGNELSNNNGVKDISELINNHRDKIKINGVERELTYQEMKALAGKAYAADEKFRQAAEKEKLYSDSERIYKDRDIKAFLNKAGISNPQEAKDFLEKILLPIYEEEEREKLNPDAYRADKAEKELERRKAEDAQKEEERKEQERIAQETKQVHAYFSELDKEFEEGFKKMGIKSSHLYHDLAIKEMRDALEMGQEISAYDALKLADKHIEREMKRKLMNLGPDNIINYLGKDGLKKIREFDTKKVVQANSVLKSKSQSENKPTYKSKIDSKSNSKVEPRESMDDYFSRIRKI